MQAHTSDWALPQLSTAWVFSRGWRGWLLLGMAFVRVKVWPPLLLALPTACQRCLSSQALLLLLGMGMGLPHSPCITFHSVFWWLCHGFPSAKGPSTWDSTLKLISLTSSSPLPLRNFMIWHTQWAECDYKSYRFVGFELYLLNCYCVSSAHNPLLEIEIPLEPKSSSMDFCLNHTTGSTAHSPVNRIIMKEWEVQLSSDMLISRIKI